MPDLRSQVHMHMECAGGVTYFENLGPSTSLSLKLLTFKLVMLMALTRPSRSADLAFLQLDR